MAAVKQKPAHANQLPGFVSSLLSKFDYSRESSRVLLSALIAVVFVVACYCVYPNYCQSNDDCGMDAILSGSFTGTPDARIVFVNYALSFIASLPYHLDPSLPWWGYLHVVMQLLTVFVACKSLMKTLSKSDLHVGLRIAAIILALLMVFLYPVTRTNYGVISTLVGSGALLLMYCMDYETDSRATIVADAILASVMLVLSYCFRVQAFRVIAVLLVLLCVYLVVSSPKCLQGLKRLALIVVPTFACIGLLFCVNNAVYGDEEWQDFYGFNSARGGYMDFHHYSYTENPDAFESAGIQKHLAVLIYRFYVADDRIDRDVYKHLNENDDRNADKSLGESVVGLLRSNYLVQANLAICIFAFVVSLIYVRRNRGRPALASALFAACLLGLSIAFMVYLCNGGRTIVRAVLAYSVPTSLMAIACSFRLVRGLSFQSINSLAPLAFTAIMVMGVVMSNQGLLSNSELRTMDAKTARYETLINYADENRIKDGQVQIYFSDYTACEDNLIFQKGRSDGQIRTVYPLYGWYQKSPLAKEKQAALGIDKCSPEMFTKDNVYFVTSDKNYAHSLRMYINETLGTNYSWEVVDKLDNGLVVRRLRLADAEEQQR